MAAPQQAALGYRDRGLDPDIYYLSDDNLAFFKKQTGIEDEEALKNHVISVQGKAYTVFPYPCIRMFGFTRCVYNAVTRTKINKNPGYQGALQLGKERSGAILLDIGCCFGNELRRAVADGFPISGAIGSDLRPEFWDFGHELFKTTPETFPAAFVAGDAFDPEFIAPRDVFIEAPKGPAPDLHTIRTLTPLQGHVSAIHAGAFFHLFDEEKQRELGKQIASLLSPLPGSVIFGNHVGRPEGGVWGISSHGNSKYGHSPETWKELWDGGIFAKGSVSVNAGLREIDHPVVNAHLGPTWFLWWSVTRL